ncbi:hypothetical protein [Thalassomonas actiniarum]|uniref:Uncharacterized protein n=1 Tax=Thalassomonas actiniarum TaxID=485447 RepID=A0AAE9YRY7_9GAMM|nr:hypothetical protein [Thalassomonas actiniarum]WDD99179.1 hypothetical protein SG35_000370 [Thalassomonas actiniarum]
MRELTVIEKQQAQGGVVFVAYFAAAYVGTFAASAGFAYGAVEAMAKNKE